MRKLTAKEIVEVSGGRAAGCGPSLGGFLWYLMTDCILCDGGTQVC
ncbi:hypothetical protein P6166_13010 [Stenotrophomonas sp. HITSZ_GD]|nr:MULTISPECIES: hypothetical protein [Stenotrophomonas]MDG2526274.1 hypothetical protein [Stenotrophomonas sp. HITSZ_GD]